MSEESYRKRINKDRRHNRRYESGCMTELEYLEKRLEEVSHGADFWQRVYDRVNKLRAEEREMRNDISTQEYLF